MSVMNYVGTGVSVQISIETNDGFSISTNGLGTATADDRMNLRWTTVARLSPNFVQYSLCQFAMYHDRLSRVASEDAGTR